MIIKLTDSQNLLFTVVLHKFVETNVYHFSDTFALINNNQSINKIVIK